MVTRTRSLRLASVSFSAWTYARLWTVSQSASVVSTTMTTVAWSSGSMSPSQHESSLLGPTASQVPCEGVTLTTSRSTSRSSQTWTFSATPSPSLVMVRVYEYWSPRVTTVADASFAMLVSGVPTASPPPALQPAWKMA